MSLTGHRQASFDVILLDGDEQEKGRLDGVTGGEVTLNAGTRLRTSGSLTIIDRGQNVDWARDRVKIVYRLASGETWPLGVFLFASPKRAYGAGARTLTVDLLSKLSLLDGDCFVAAYQTVPANHPLVHVRHLLTGVGPVDLTDGGPMLTSSMVWDAGTPKLTAINDILQAIGFWALTVTPAGAFQVAPYVEPTKRARVWEFKEGDKAIHSAEFTREQDLAEIPNRYIVVGQGNGREAGAVGFAENRDPASASSFPARGRWVSKVETGAQVANQDIANSLARRRLQAASAAIGKLEIAHLPLPLVPNDLVAYQTGDVSVLATVQSTTLRLEATALQSTTLREVATL